MTLPIGDWLFYLEGRTYSAIEVSPIRGPLLGICKVFGHYKNTLNVDI